MTILVVDDERALADTLAAIMRRAGYESTAVYSASEALALLDSLRPALIISDVMMPGTNGVEFAIKARELNPEIRVLLISGHAGSEDLVESRSRNFSFPLMAKPVAPRELLATVAQMLNGVA